MKTQSYDFLSVGARVRKAREHLSFTQEYVSNVIEVSPQHISDIERGEVGVSLGTLIKLCDTLNVSADYILFGKDVAYGGNAIYQILEQLDDKDKFFIEDFIDFYIKRLQTADR